MKEDIWNIFKIALLAAIVLLLASCKTIERIEYIPVETTKTEHKDRLVEIYDSIYVHDSIYVAVKGDTIFKYRQQTVYKDKITHDTLVVIHTDSIRVPYPIERQLSKLQQFKIDYMDYLVTLLLTVLAAIIIYIRWRLKPRDSA